MALLAAGSVIAQSEFKDSMNNEVLEAINGERAKNGLPALIYNFGMQNVADQIAEKIKTNLCHCYGDTFVTESLYAAPSLKAVIDDMKSMKAKNNPLKTKGIRSVVIGISDDEDSYYYSIRTF